jgi:hypothetical protein
MSEPTEVTPYSTEIVWDGGFSATGLSVGGQTLTIGYDGIWGPEQLMLLGIESSFMNSFLSAAREAGIHVLGYVSSAHLELGEEQPAITLRPCVVVASADQAERALLVSIAARRQSIAGRLLGRELRVSLDVQLELSA